jgi:hypothetical protein
MALLGSLMAFSAQRKEAFGQAMIDGATGALTVTLKDVEDRALWSITLDPASTD